MNNKLQIISLTITLLCICYFLYLFTKDVYHYKKSNRSFNNLQKIIHIYFDKVNVNNIYLYDEVNIILNKSYKIKINENNAVEKYNEVRTELINLLADTIPEIYIIQRRETLNAIINDK